MTNLTHEDKIEASEKSQQIHDAASSSDEFCRVHVTTDIFSEGDIAVYKRNRTMLMNIHSKKLTSFIPESREELTVTDMKNVNLGYGYGIVVSTPDPSKDDTIDLYLNSQVFDVIQLFCRSDNVIQGLNWRTGSIGFYCTRRSIIISNSTMKTMNIDKGQLQGMTVKQLQKQFPSNNTRKRVKVPLFKQERSAVMIQRVYRRFKSLSRLKKSLRKFREYLNLEKEFYTSEKKYIDYLNVIIDLYLVPLRQMVGTENEIIDSKQITKIFGNIETIVKLNQEFYKELLEAKRHKTKHLADVMLWFLPYLKMYITFISQYEDATRLIKSLATTDSQFRNLLIKALEDPRSLETVSSNSKPLGLTDLMPKPLQRIFAYNNMLQRMAEILPKEARVYNNVVHVKTEMENHIMWVNETKKTIDLHPKCNSAPEKKRNFFNIPKVHVAVDKRKLTKNH